MYVNKYIYIYIYIYAGWWFQPLWNIVVSWDEDIANIWKVIKFMFQTTNQYVIYTLYDYITLW